jgi:drug/metabolite transporter (DMT)-like permease
MMWIPVTLAAATFQVLRTSQQHQLRGRLSANAAGFVRYLYGAPVALLVCVVLFVVLGRDVPGVPPRFWPTVVAAGVAQIVGTIALLHSFRMRDFAVGTVYSKTEVIQVALLSAVLLGEPLEPLGWAGAAVCMVGVAALASRGSLGTLLRRAGDPAALFGAAAGGGFALAAIGIRASSRALGEAPAFDRAVVTLTVMLLTQTIINGTQLALGDRAQLATTLRLWRPELPVGLLSVAGSLGWALAVTLENAAKVRTLGQVELLLVFAISWLRLGERHARSEYAASALVVAGVVIVTTFG